MIVAVVYNLWVLRAQALTVEYPNDVSMHLQMVTMANHLLSMGRFPLGQWYPYLSQGSPFFVQYQSMSAILTGALGEIIGVHMAVSGTLYLLIALWPICIYWSARLLGWERWVAATAAAMAPLLFSVTSHGFEAQSYDWLGNGLWSQLWAMWTLPLAWGFSWRFISQRRYLFGAVATLALTIVFHFLTAYLAGLTLLAWVVIQPHGFLRRLGRAWVVGAGALLATLWVTWPLLVEGKWMGVDTFQTGTVIDDSYGARKVLGWLVTGQIYDSGRFPVITIFVAIGLGICLSRFRSDERARALISVWVLSLLLFFGRPTLGPVLNLLPGNSNLLFQRYVSGVHLSGLFLAGVGAVGLARFLWTLAHRMPYGAVRGWLASSWLPRLQIPAVVLMLVAALSPAWWQLHTYEARGAYWIHWQRSADQVQGSKLNQLLAIVKSRGDGRVYAGLPSNWGFNFDVGAVPVYSYMTQAADIDSVGFTLRTSALMTVPEAYFDESNLGDYSTFGVRYLILPNGHAPPVPATLIKRSGNYDLWSVRSSGLIQVVDTQSSIAATRGNIGQQTSSFLQSSLPGENVYPTIAYDGHAAAAATLPTGSPPSQSAGVVIHQHLDLLLGRATATVFAHRTAVVLFKVSFDPGWRVSVDGQSTATEMVAPALVGVRVAPGVHTVVFQYQGYSSYPLLFGVGLITLVGLGVCTRPRRRASTRQPRRITSARGSPESEPKLD